MVQRRVLAPGYRGYWEGGALSRRFLGATDLSSAPRTRGRQQFRVRTSVPVPHLSVTILAFLAPVLKTRRVITALDYGTSSGGFSKADARAKKSGDVEIGSCVCADGPDPRKYCWPSIRLTPEKASWAFMKDTNPQRVITGLALFGTLLSIIFLLPSYPPRSRPRGRD